MLLYLDEPALGAARESLKEQLKQLELSPRELRYVMAYLVNGGCKAQAGIQAGYSESSSTKGWVTKVHRRPRVQEALSLLATVDVAILQTIFQRLVGLAIHTDIADFAPLIYGEMDLVELRDSGVDTRAIESVKMERTINPDGSVRERMDLKLYSAKDSMKTLLARRAVRKLEDGPGATNGEGDDPNLAYDVEALHRTLADQANKPIAPGLPSVNQGIDARRKRIATHDQGGNGGNGKKRRKKGGRGDGR